MIYKVIIPILILLGGSALAQYVPPNPDPGCAPNSVGHMQANGQDTQYFVSGYSIDGNGHCDGASAIIQYGNLAPGEYAYATFDAGLINETPIESVDFSFDLSDTLASLPIGQDVKIAELHSSNALIADLTLMKMLNFTEAEFGGSNSPKGRPSNDPYVWRLTVDWNGSNSEDTFTFGMNEVVEYNYIWDDSDPNFPVKMISFGGNKISVNQFSPGNGIGASINWGAFELVSYNLGFIETSATLNQGDQIVFDINWSVGSEIQ